MKITWAVSFQKADNSKLCHFEKFKQNINHTATKINFNVGIKVVINYVYLNVLHLRRVYE